MGVKKMLEEGCTTIFHLENKGVTVHTQKEHSQSQQAIHRCSKGAKKQETTYGQWQQMRKVRKKQTMFTTYH